MQVIRWRKNNGSYGNLQIGDSGRMKIQQDFLKAVIKQLMTPANVLNIGKISTVFQESVETDLSFQEILWFGQQAVSGGLSVENVEFMTMPWYGAGAWSRSYNQNLSYVIPKANDLLELVNNKLSPFVDPFVLSDLDLMSVNSDGSLRSTTGYVEDSKAALPPVKPVENDVTGTLDENGNIVDPETGESGSDDGMIVIDPSTGEVAEDPDDSTSDTQPEDPPVHVEPEQEDVPENEVTVPETPVVPAEPEEIGTPGFSIIEPPPAA